MTCQLCVGWMDEAQQEVSIRISGLTPGSSEWPSQTKGQKRAKQGGNESHTVQQLFVICHVSSLRASRSLGFHVIRQTVYAWACVARRFGENQEGGGQSKIKHVLASFGLFYPLFSFSFHNQIKPTKTLFHFETSSCAQLCLKLNFFSIATAQARKESIILNEMSLKCSWVRQVGLTWMIIRRLNRQIKNWWCWTCRVCQPLPRLDSRD